MNWSVKDKIYWINNFEVLKSYDGTTVASVGGSPPIGSQVELHDDRLWILQNNLVYFSDLNVDNVWPAANALNLADKFGGTGQFLKSFGRGLLIAGKDSGIYRFEGSPKLGGRLTRYSDVKCVAPWSAAIVPSQKGTPDSLIFLAQDGVYATDGFNCGHISEKIDPLFTGFFRTAVGKYYPKKRQYFLAFSTTGAANDFDQATNIARNMVIEYGMSDLGPINYGPTRDVTEWGRAFYDQTHLSEETMNKIDHEVKRIITECYDEAAKLLKKHRKQLDKVAELLLKKESIDGDEFEKLVGKRP